MSTLPPASELTPSERLTLSRERLRLAMRPVAVSASASAFARPGTGAPWLAGLKRLPGFEILRRAAGAWWAQQPLHDVVVLLADAAKTVIQPMAKRNPLAMLLCAAVLSGLFAWRRPWRWVLTPALFAGLFSQLVSKAMGQMPPETWLTILATLAAQPRKTAQQPRPDRAS